MGTAAPIALVGSPHRPTRELIAALAVRGWLLVGIDGYRAVVRHPKLQKQITIVADPRQPERIAYASVDGIATTPAGAVAYVLADDDRPRAANPLTLKERTVLERRAAGMTYRAIADEIGTSGPGVVHKMLMGAMRKTRTKSWVQAAAVAAAEGWISTIGGA